MIVHLTATAATVLEADDCGRLHVTGPPSSAELESALRATGTGRPHEDGDVLLDVAVLRDRARAAAREPGWDDRWRKMIDYAARSGWLTADGGSVRAHVERAR